MNYDNCPFCNKKTYEIYSLDRSTIIVFDCINCDWTYYPSLKNLPKEDDHYEGYIYKNIEYSIKEFEKLLKLKSLL